MANAAALQEAGAALVVADIDPPALLAALTGVLAGTLPRRATSAPPIAAFAHFDAADRLAAIILEAAA